MRTYSLAKSKLAFDCPNLKRDGEIEKCYNISGIVNIVKNNKLMKLYHLKDFQELFPEYVFDNSDHVCFRKFPVLLNVRSSYSSAFLV